MAELRLRRDVIKIIKKSSVKCEYSRYTIHCLHFLLPPVKDQVYTLRPKSHPYQLSSHKYQLHRRSFIPRYLFRSVY